jgi:hypothetical protein
MDFLISHSKAALNRLPLEERAKILGALPDRLSLKDLAKLSTIDNSEKEKAILSALIELCKNGKIKCYGNIHGWEWGGGEMTYVANPYPEVRGSQVDMGNPLTTAVYNKYRAFPGDCLVHREDFKRYLEQVKQWPLNGVLANWWPAESIEISEAIKRRIAFDEAVKNNQVNLDVDTLPAIHRKLSLANPDLWPPSFDGFKSWWQKQTDLKLKSGRKPSNK